MLAKLLFFVPVGYYKTQFPISLIVLRHRVVAEVSGCSRVACFLP